MSHKTVYQEFLVDVGRPLINSIAFSNGFGIPSSFISEAISILERDGVAILGGDVLVDTDQIPYFYQHFGDEYVYLNWATDRISGESFSEYTSRTVMESRQAIETSLKLAQNFSCELLFVLTLSDECYGVANI